MARGANRLVFRKGVKKGRVDDKIQAETRRPNVRPVSTSCPRRKRVQDPLFGATALDRAADAGKDDTDAFRVFQGSAPPLVIQERAALRLLELGADPGAGRGAPWSHLQSQREAGTPMPGNMYMAEY